MDYGTRVHRLLRIITMIQSRDGWSSDGLAEAVGISVRHLYRDIRELKAAGVPVHYDRETKQYRITGDFFMPPLRLDLPEALALAALCEQLSDAEQIPFLKPAWRALHKIEAQLPHTLRTELAERSRAIAIRLGQTAPPDGYGDVYDRVQHAIAKREMLRCKYEAVVGASDGSTDFLFAPYALFFAVRAWYAVGRRSDRADLRCLKLNRFTKVEPTNEPYAVPDDFSLDAYLGNAWRMMRGENDYDVEIDFDAEFAETIADTQWHRTQEIDWHGDGSCTFRCMVSGLDEIVWWVLSMGPHCTVRRPRELADRVAVLARRTADRYPAG